MTINPEPSTMAKVSCSSKNKTPRVIPNSLSILWEDGHHDDFDVRDLRLACHCSLCIEEMSGRKLLDPKSLRSDVNPQRIVNKGTYAIQFDWSDGYNIGIYTFKDLRALGECAAAKSVENV